MKRLFPLIALLLITSSAEAQLFKSRDKKAAKTEYNIGSVPVENKHVVFREKIEASGLSAAQVMERVRSWYDKRYVKPAVIESKIIKNEVNTFEAKAEEYIVFTKKLFVLNRARMYYYLTINSYDGGCEVIMSRISYWHDEENPDGGIRYTAEELITDEKALESDTSLKRNEGKFRTKTIDLKNNIIKELKDYINN